MEKNINTIKAGKTYPYKDDNGEIIKDAYVVISKKIEKIDIEDLSSQNYLEISKKLLTHADYNVEIHTVTYKDTKTGKLVRGSILVDKDDLNIFYHFIINGHLPSFKHDSENPLLKKVNIGDYIKIIKHKKDLPFIKSPEFEIK